MIKKDKDRANETQLTQEDYQQKLNEKQMIGNKGKNEWCISDAPL